VTTEATILRAEVIDPYSPPLLQIRVFHRRLPAFLWRILTALRYLPLPPHSLISRVWLDFFPVDVAGYVLLHLCWIHTACHHTTAGLPLCTFTLQVSPVATAHTPFLTVACRSTTPDCSYAFTWTTPTHSSRHYTCRFPHRRFFSVLPAVSLSTFHCLPATPTACILHFLDSRGCLTYYGSCLRSLLHDTLLPLARLPACHRAYRGLYLLHTLLHTYWIHFVPAILPAR